MVEFRALCLPLCAQLAWAKEDELCTGQRGHTPPRQGSPAHCCWGKQTLFGCCSSDPQDLRGDLSVTIHFPPGEAEGKEARQGGAKGPSGASTAASD